MPYHYDDGGRFHTITLTTVNNGTIILVDLYLVIKLNRNLGVFAEGKYNKYWNREWYDFKAGINYIIF